MSAELIPLNLGQPASIKLNFFFCFINNCKVLLSFESSRLNYLVATVMLQSAPFPESATKPCNANANQKQSSGSFGMNFYCFLAGFMALHIDLNLWYQH